MSSCRFPANRAEGGRGNIKVGAFPLGTSRNRALQQSICAKKLLSARLCSTTGDVLGTVLAVGRQVGDRLIRVSLRMTNQIEQRLRKSYASMRRTSNRQSATIPPPQACPVCISRSNGTKDEGPRSPTCHCRGQARNCWRISAPQVAGNLSLPPISLPVQQRHAMSFDHLSPSLHWNRRRNTKNGPVTQDLLHPRSVIRLVFFWAQRGLLRFPFCRSASASTEAM